MDSLDAFISDSNIDNEPVNNDEIGQWLNDNSDQKRLELSHKESIERDSDRSSRILQMQLKTGLPEELIDRELEAIEKESKKQEFKSEDFMKKSPVAAKWLADNPNHFAIAKDDVEKLSYLERQFKHITSQFNKGKTTVDLADIGQSAILGTITSEQRDLQKALEDELSQTDDYGIDGFFEQIPGAVANQLPILGNTLSGSVKGIGAGALIGAGKGAAAAAVAGQLGPQVATPEEVVTVPAAAIAGATAGAVTGWRLGAGLEAARLEASLAYLEFEKIKDDNGNPLDRDTAIGAAVMVGVVNGSLEMIGLEKAIPGITTLKRSGIKKALMNQSARRVLLSYAKNIGQAMATEGITEGIQELVTSSGGKIAKMAQDGSLGSMSTSEFLGEIFDEEAVNASIESARAGAQAGGGMSMGSSAASSYSDFKKVKQARLNKEAFKKLGKGVKELSFADKLPEKTKEVVEELAKSTSTENVYTPVETFQEYWQSKGLNPDEVATEILGEKSNAYDEAVQTGGDIEIPMNIYATKIAPTEHNEFFQNEIRSDLDAMNAREAQEFINELDKSDVQTDTIDESTKEVDEIQELLVDQLMASGLEKRNAETSSLQMRKFFETVAERSGNSAKELFERYGLEISNPELQNEQQVGERVFSQDHSVEARKRRAEAAGFDTSRVLHHGTNKEFNEFRGDTGGLSGPGTYFYIDDKVAAEQYGERVVEAYVSKGKYLNFKNTSLDEFQSLANEIGVDITAWMARREELIAGSRKRGQESIKRIEARRIKDNKPPMTEKEKENFLKYDPFDGEDPAGELANAISENEPDRDFQEIMDEVHERLKEAGYIGVESLLNGVPIVAIWDPVNIRSVDAKFDPAAGDSANIFAQGKKGRIRFNDNKKAKIDLFEEADLSTFLHESGHFYLEILNDLVEKGEANDQLIGDFNIILEWMGVKSFKDIKTEHHEKFAESFEAYLMEGKAPSIELRSAFSKFKAWLSNIYRSLKLLNADLNDEVRGVFDRLLATDDEIAIASSEQSYNQLFENPEELGMSESEANKYRLAVSEAKKTAEEELLSKHMKQVAREKKSIWREERAKVKSEVEGDVNSMPIYIALSNMQNGKLPNGDSLPKGIKQIKLNKKALLDTYGKDYLKRLPRPYIYAKEGGVHHDMAAEMFGFESGDQLLKEIIASEKRVDLIDRLTDAKMKESHGDLLTDGSAKSEALKAVHNDKKAQLLRKELQYLASNNLPALKGLVKKVSRKVPTIDIVKTQAKSIIGKKHIKDIRPYNYLKAEKKNSKLAIELLMKGDIEGAFEAKKKELFNHEMYRESLKIKDSIDKSLAYIKRFEKKETRSRLGKAGQQYLEQIDSLMDRFSFKSSISLKSLEKQKTLLKFVQEQNELGLTVDVPEKILNEAYKTNYKEMSYDDFMGVKDLIKNIDHLTKLKNKLLANKKAKDLSQAIDDMRATVDANHEVSPEPIDFAPDFKKRQLRKVKQVMASHTKMEFLFEWLDGNKENGAFWNYFFKPIADAENAENTMMREVSAKMNEIFSSYSMEERVNWYHRKEFIPEINTSMNKANILAVALNWGNSYNRQALMEGYGWSESQVNAILSKLDKRDWNTVQKLWDYIESFWPQIEVLEKDLNGVAPQKVKADSFEIKVEGESKSIKLNGGYYPIIFDSNLSHRAYKREEASNVRDIFGGTWAKAMTRKGHTKERTSSGKQPIKLELSGLTNHISNVVHDITHRRAVVDVSRLIENKEVRNLVESVAGKEMYRQLNPWLKAIASDTRGEPTNGFEGFFTRARKGATIVNMGWKLTTAVVQFTGYSISSKELGGKYAFQGLKDTLKNPLKINEAYKFVSERSEMMRDRLGNYDRDIHDALKKLNVAGAETGYFTEAASSLGLESTAEFLAKTSHYSSNVTDSWFSMIGYMDLAVSLPTWMGAYRKALDGNVENIKAGDELSAIDYADGIVRKTQGAGAPKDLALVQRGSEVFKLFTMFYSFFSVLFNQFQKTGNQFVSDKDVPKLMGSLFLLWFLPAVIEDLILGRGPGEDAEAEEYAKWALKKEVMYPFQSVVLMRDVVNGMDEYGYSPSAAFDFFESVSRLGSLAVKKATDEDAEVTRKDVKSVFMTTGYLVGLPSRQVWQTSEYFYDYINGDIDEENPFKAMWQGVVSGRKRD